MARATDELLRLLRGYEEQKGGFPKRPPVCGAAAEEDLPRADESLDESFRRLDKPADPGSG